MIKKKCTDCSGTKVKVKAVIADIRTNKTGVQEITYDMNNGSVELPPDKDSENTVVVEIKEVEKCDKCGKKFKESWPQKE